MERCTRKEKKKTKADGEKVGGDEKEKEKVSSSSFNTINEKSLSPLNVIYELQPTHL